jgi:hypothetical protein
VSKQSKKKRTSTSSTEVEESAATRSRKRPRKEKDGEGRTKKLGTGLEKVLRGLKIAVEGLEGVRTALLDEQE